MARKGQFTKGDPRINRKGRPKIGKSLAEMFRDAGDELLDKQNGYRVIHSMIDAVKQKALKGDIPSIEFFMARGYGKLIERIETNNTNKNYDFSNLSLDERMKLLELLKNANAIVPDDNPDTP